jgi:hypothetical protein
LGLGLGLGFGLVAADAYYPYYEPVYAEAPVVQSEPVVTQTETPSTWYYCDASENYYPYVSSCSVPWRPVNTVPPGPVQP